MAPPMIIAGISAGASIAGGLMQAAGARAAGDASSSMGMFQAAVAQRNAAIARQNAEYADYQGEKQAQTYGMGAAQRMGHIKAGQGASGLDVNSGSAKDVQASQSVVTTMDMNQIRENAAKAAFDYRVQASSFDMEAVGDMFGAQNARTAAGINANASIISSAGSVADKWLAGKNVGLWGGGGSAPSGVGDPMQLPGALLGG